VISALTQREHLTEIVELPQDVHPRFMGVQFHPDSSPRPGTAIPVQPFIHAACEHQPTRTRAPAANR
jgi:CTP synthase